MVEKVMSENGFRARDIGLRAQKKILSRMSTKTVAKTFIDGTTASLLDNIYRLAKVHSGDRNTAEHLTKNIIKIVIKIGILLRNKQFNADELEVIRRFHSKFTLTQMAIISFIEVEFSFDLPYLQKALSEHHTALKTITQRHLTDKSLKRIDEIFQFFNDPKLLETTFRHDSPYREIIESIVGDLNKGMENGSI